MKKNLLIVYSKMIVGGSTTSLLSLLNEFDYSQYNIDLLLYEKGGVLEDQIPANVNILDNAFLRTKKNNFFYTVTFIRSYINSKIHRNPLIRSQLMSQELAKHQPKLEKNYDAAIAYMEFWPSNYVYQKIDASRKLLWLHCDYKGTGLSPKYDKRMYSNVDAVVTVSEACNDNFKELFLSVNSVFTIHNILSSKTILSLAQSFEPNEELYRADFIFITVARIDFNSKGHDRGVHTFKKMKELYPDKTFKWLIIGDGSDRAKLEKIINNAGLENEIILLGEMTNPHPYVRKSDIFFLPSRYEGKPMSVTEAQMNGVVPFVTNYASAKGQINHMKDGLICDNDDQAIIDMMSRVFSGEIDLNTLKKNVSQADYSNREEINKLYELLS